MKWTDEELEILKLTPEEQAAFDKYAAQQKKAKNKKRMKNKNAKKARKRNRK